jgi:hypothetical protein
MNACFRIANRLCFALTVLNFCCFIDCLLMNLWLKLHRLLYSRLIGKKHSSKKTCFFARKKRVRFFQKKRFFCFFRFFTPLVYIFIYIYIQLLP